MSNNNYEELIKAFGGDGSVKIAVIGIGGGGNNSISHMSLRPIAGVDFYAANTDIQALGRMSVKTIPLGPRLTKGMGTGGDPTKGREAALESKEEIQKILTGYDVVFLTTGLGGGTGSGASTVFADICKSLGILTVGIVTKPFKFEGTVRSKISEVVMSELLKILDSLIVIPNDKLLDLCGKDATLIEAFQMSNKVLDDAVRSITTLLTEPGFINVDCADVFSIIADMGQGIIVTSSASGELRSKTALDNALNSPLLSDTDITSAKGILVNVSSGLNMKLSEFEYIGDALTRYMQENTKVVMGTSIDPDADDLLTVSLIITGAHTSKKKSSHTSEHNERLFSGERKEKDKTANKLSDFFSKKD